MYEKAVYLYTVEVSPASSEWGDVAHTVYADRSKLRAVNEAVRISEEFDHRVFLITWRNGFRLHEDRIA